MEKRKDNEGNSKKNKYKSWLRLKRKQKEKVPFKLQIWMSKG